MKFAIAAAVGGSVALAGVVLGNMAALEMMDRYDDHVRASTEMLSTAERTFSGDRRNLASEWYRKNMPKGPLIRKLRMGQIMTVIGAVLGFALLAL